MCGTGVDEGLDLRVGQPAQGAVVGWCRGVGGGLVDSGLWVVDLGLVGGSGDVVYWGVVEGGGGHVVDHRGGLVDLVRVVAGLVVGSWVSVSVTFLPRIETDLRDGDSITRHQRVTENITTLNR